MWTHLPRLVSKGERERERERERQRERERESGGEIERDRERGRVRKPKERKRKRSSRHCTGSDPSTPLCLALLLHTSALACLGRRRATTLWSASRCAVGVASGHEMGRRSPSGLASPARGVRSCVALSTATVRAGGSLEGWRRPRVDLDTRQARDTHRRSSNSSGSSSSVRGSHSSNRQHSVWCCLFGRRCTQQLQCRF